MADMAPRIWQVSALSHALADTLEARFSAVTVLGELSGVTRASSGHCYFSLKDASAQLRCVMFKRAGAMLDFTPRDGQLVELRARVTLYEPRGDLQLMVESMRAAGAGALFEQFMRLKVRLEGEGLFEPQRKRPLPAFARAVGIVTSLGAAALRDVAATLQRRAPHVPVVLSPAQVQGQAAAADLIQALLRLYAMTPAAAGPEPAGQPAVDVILLVRGGGALEDLWAFNDESLARTIARSPVPVVTGVGHETDFTIADFVADVRAPTPTAAAEMVATSRATWLDALTLVAGRLEDSVWRRLDQHLQRLDAVALRLGRPSARVSSQRLMVDALAARLRQCAQQIVRSKGQALRSLGQQIPDRLALGLERRRARLERAAMQLSLLDPGLVLRRGYAWIVDEAGHTVMRPEQVHSGQRLRASIAHGALDLQVTPRD